MNGFNLDVEFTDRAVTMTLPACLPLEMVSDLCEYMGCYMAPFGPRQVAHQIKFALPKIPTEQQQENFFKALRRHTECWFACYPKKIEEKQKEMVMLGRHLKVVPVEI